MPCLPALVMTSEVMPVSKIGLFNGNTALSASGAVATKPMTAVDDVVSVRKAWEISVTLTPCKNSSDVFSPYGFCGLKR